MKKSQFSCVFTKNLTSKRAVNKSPPPILPCERIEENLPKSANLQNAPGPGRIAVLDNKQSSAC